jgi:iron complex transport system substrate-binding protein
MSRFGPSFFDSSLSRRTMLGATLGVAATSALLSGSTIAQESTPAASPEIDRPWSFTDDKGVTVSLETRPERIVADVNAAAPLWDFGIRPVAVFGWNASETGDFGPAGGNIDPNQVDVVGDPVETIQLEKTIVAQPDLLITVTWTPDDPTEYWSIGTEVLPQVLEIAPLIAISATGSADVNTERFAELAVALGADLETPELVEAKARYDQALADFPAAAAGQSSLRVLFIYAAEGESIYVANPIDWADLTLYQSLGLNIVQPEVEPGTFWEELSTELANKYPADIIFHSTRPGTMTPDELAAHPTLGQHPAVKAGQIGAWNQDFIMSYQGMTDALETTIATVSASTPVI